MSERVVENEPKEKVCSRCKGEPQPIANFKLSKRDNMHSVVFFRRSECRVCTRAIATISNERRKNGEPRPIANKYTYPDLLENDESRLFNLVNKLMKAPGVRV